MPQLQYHRSTLTAAAHPNIITVDNLPRCLLRVINLTDATDRCLCSVQIMRRGDMPTSTENISLMHRVEAQAGIDVSWQGSVELGADQVLKVVFEDSAGVAPTAGDALACTIGYEYL